MPTLEILLPDGTERTVPARAGDNLMRRLRQDGLPVPGDCNGALACATCHVVLDPAWPDELAPPSEAEEAMLDAVFGLTPTSRLACQIRIGADEATRRLSLPA